MRSTLPMVWENRARKVRKARKDLLVRKVRKDRPVRRGLPAPVYR